MVAGDCKVRGPCFSHHPPAERWGLVFLFHPPLLRKPLHLGANLLLANRDAPWLRRKEPVLLLCPLRILATALWVSECGWEGLLGNFQQQPPPPRLPLRAWLWTA